jgi:hypothetical protein
MSACHGWNDGFCAGCRLCDVQRFRLAVIGESDIQSSGGLSSAVNRFSSGCPIGPSTSTGIDVWGFDFEQALPADPAFPPGDSAGEHARRSSSYLVRKSKNVRAEEAARPLKATTRNSAVELVTRMELTRPTGKLGLRRPVDGPETKGPHYGPGPVHSGEGARRHGESCRD